MAKQGSMRGEGGGSMHGEGGGEHAWRMAKGGACVARGVCIPSTPPRVGYYEIWLINARAVSILLECILVELLNL